MVAAWWAWWDRHWWSPLLVGFSGVALVGTLTVSWFSQARVDRWQRFQAQHEGCALRRVECRPDTCSTWFAQMVCGDGVEVELDYETLERWLQHGR